MSIELCRTLIQLSFATPDAIAIDSAKKQLQTATDKQWEQCLATLGLHRLSPLVFYGLEVAGLTSLVPKSYLDRLQVAYQTTLKRNNIFLLTLDALLQRMQARDLHPTIWKGIALADSFYPNPGTRPMGDLDFAIFPEEMEEATRVFQSLGFRLDEQAETDDAVYFVNPMGVKCDVHHRVRLFEGIEPASLVTQLNPRHLQVETLQVLDPSTTLVHLVVHMDGHRHETGPLLSWILDIAFVLRKWGDRINLARVEAMMPDKTHWVSLMRSLRFLETELGETLPESLASAAREFEPLTLAEILRQRRLALWGLPHLRGWLRLGASQVDSQLRLQRPALVADDLLLWVGDFWRQRRTLRMADAR
ncbi:nucleotidyltransferase family protein [Oscillatoriales cyanobacterium LEGE 11467]|uniref:Nucleotidyltransferase family protein n=1 Tax=Zarconia navalis LEGE 11467 TaxID=1828826 RepID=A0A928Z922_9CYAN|nr:nucleotidyltransferase family protein [Zarconia navalis]MBE9041273.1 nucleotidyltransferase family protein [Zarconia navalis LEGE 11467]